MQVELIRRKDGVELRAREIALGWYKDTTLGQELLRRHLARVAVTKVVLHADTEEAGRQALAVFPNVLVVMAE